MALALFVMALLTLLLTIGLVAPRPRSASSGCCSNRAFSPSEPCSSRRTCCSLRPCGSRWTEPARPPPGACPLSSVTISRVQRTGFRGGCGRTATVPAAPPAGVRTSDAAMAGSVPRPPGASHAGATTNEPVAHGRPASHARMPANESSQPCVPAKPTGRNDAIGAVVGRNASYAGAGEPKGKIVACGRNDREIGLGRDPSGATGRDRTTPAPPGAGVVVEREERTFRRSRG